MSGELRHGSAHVGDHVHYHSMSCEPADLWGVVVIADVHSDRMGHCFQVRMCDTGEAEFTEHKHPKDHCTIWKEPPDEFFVWQAKRVLLPDLTK